MAIPKAEDLKTLKAITAEMERLDEVMRSHNKTSKSYQQAQEKILMLKKESFKFASRGMDIEKSISNIQSTILGKAIKQKGFEKELLAAKKLAQKGTKEEQKDYKKLLQYVDNYANGTMNTSEFISEMAENLGEANNLANTFGQLAIDSGDSLERMAKITKKVKGGFSNIADTLLGIDVAETFTLAGAIAAITSFALKAKEVKNTLGTTALESARVAGNMTAAGTAARLMGGNAQEAEAAVTAMVDEFGTLNVLSLETSLSLGAMVADTGLTGANAAKLLKSMESISTASIETNMNLISSTAELARAEGVAPAQVLNDIAESTETFAEFAKDGGKNIAKAAIEARKLGLNLGTVAGIANNLLDFESSIEKEMEASMLLGRQMSLDKARELALTGDLAGLAEEVKNQVGSQAEFEAMNVVQRRALASAIGVSAADLGKMVAGEKTSAEMAEEKNRQQQKFIGLQKLAANAQIIGAVASMFAGNAKFGPLGAGLAAAGIMAMYAAISSAPKLEKGGVVKETGMAVVHKGEVFSGTRNEMGMGNGQTNKLLRELITQNEFLMNRLTNRVGDMALSN